jgi:hypothetical protein
LVLHTHQDRVFRVDRPMWGLNLGKIKACGVKMETRCPLVLAVFFSS